MENNIAAPLFQENFLPKVVGTTIPGDAINYYLTEHCNPDTILRIKSVDKAIEFMAHPNRIVKNSEDFAKCFESIYNFITNGGVEASGRV
jgi:hypothetical protein